MSEDPVTTALGTVFAALPPALRDARAELWARARSEGLPAAKAERWRYTPLAPRLADVQAPPAALRIEAPEGIDDARQLIYVNGQAQDVPAEWAGSGAARHLHGGPDLINAALASGGLDIDIAAGDEQAPLHLYTQASGDGASVHLRHRLRLADGAQATLFWEDVAGAGVGLLSQTLEIELGRDARLRVLRLQEHQGGTALLRTHARLQRGASFDYTGCEASRGLLRHDLGIELLDSHASVRLRGVYVPHGDGHCDIQAAVDHAAPDTRSRFDFRGLALDAARGNFNGRVHVHPDAQRTDSEQKLATLLLSPRAQLNAKPELEIYADDVKCAHGATTGQLDENALHYLRTRGIPLPEARALLIESFAAHALTLPEWPTAGARLLAAVNAVLHGRGGDGNNGSPA